MIPQSENSVFGAKTPFVALSIAFGAGIILGHLFNPPIAVTAAAFSLFFLIAIILFLKNLPGADKISWLFLLLFFLGGTLRLSHWKDSYLHQSYLEHLPLPVDSLKASVESIREGNRISAILQMQELSRDTFSVETGGHVLAYFPYKLTGPIVQGGQIKLLNIRIEALPEPRNPGQFDYGEYLRGRGIVAQCKIDDASQIAFIKMEPDFSLENHLFAPLRSRLVRQLENHFPPFAAGFLKALLLGQREDLESTVKRDFQNAGVMHVLAISGLHVGFVALIFYVLLSFLLIYFKHRNFFIIILLVFYMLLTGSNPPVVRATLMASFYFLAINLERRGAVYNFLFAAALIILVVQPQQLFWAGFQFSFIAVLSIVYFYEKLIPLGEKLLDRIDRESNRRRVERWIVIPFVVSLSAQLGTVPLVVYYFHKFSLISFVLNILVIPYIGMIVALGFLCLFFSLLSGPLTALFANFLSFLIHLLTTIVHGAASIPAAFFDIAGFRFFHILVYFAGIMLIFHFREVRLRNVYASTVIVLLLGWGVIQVFQKPVFDLIVMDVGQGDGTLIRTPRGRVILIDTGPANRYMNAAERAIIPVMQHLGIKTIHRLFISHPHADHLGGTFRLLKYADIDSVYLPPTPMSYHWNDSLLKALEQENVPCRFIQAGERIIVDEETRVYTIGPLQPLLHYNDPSGENVNNTSLVLLLKHRQHSLLFTGDAEEEAEAYLTMWQEVLKSDFLKVGHHGSITSTTAKFLALVNPQYASISLGENNRFGHPSPLVLKRLSASGSSILRTDLQHAVWLQLRGNQWKQIEWREEN